MTYLEKGKLYKFKQVNSNISWKNVERSIYIASPIEDILLFLDYRVVPRRGTIQTVILHPRNLESDRLDGWEFSIFLKFLLGEETVEAEVKLQDVALGLKYRHTPIACVDRPEYFVHRVVEEEIFNKRDLQEVLSWIFTLAS